MQLLFNDTMFPIAESIGFLETDCQTAAQAFYDWQVSIAKKWWGNSVSKRELAGDLKSVLLALQPLNGWGDRYVWVPTKSNWTALFNSGVTSGGVMSPIDVLFEELNVRGIYASATPHTLRNNGYTGRRGGVVMTLDDPKSGQHRGINCIHEGGNRWSFEANGEPLPFEKPEYYQVKRVRDRFTPEIMDQYLQELGIHVFDDTFYMPPGSKAILVDQHNKRGKWQNYSLAEVQMNKEEKVYFTE